MRVAQLLLGAPPMTTACSETIHLSGPRIVAGDCGSVPVAPDTGVRRRRACRTARSSSARARRAGALAGLRPARTPLARRPSCRDRSRIVASGLSYVPPKPCSTSGRVAHAEAEDESSREQCGQRAAPVSAADAILTWMFAMPVPTTSRSVAERNAADCVRQSLPRDLGDEQRTEAKRLDVAGHLLGVGHGPGLAGPPDADLGGPNAIGVGAAASRHVEVPLLVGSSQALGSDWLRPKVLGDAGR